MRVSNPFVLRIEPLKTAAKRRLKQLKANDDSEWQRYRHMLSDEKKTPETIKLADVQWLIARELGVSSWAKLKAHIEEQQVHLQHIEQGSVPLDNDCRTLHIRCGHDLQSVLPQAGFRGDFLPWIDPYCVGPLAQDASMQLQERAQFIAEHYLAEVDTQTPPSELVQRIIADDVRNRACLNDAQYQRRVIWVEHDNYDQLMLIYLLAHLPSELIESTQVIEIDRFPGHARYIGLGQLPPQALRSCWQKRKAVTPEMIITAQRVWRALCCESPREIALLLSTPLDEQFAHLPHVLRRHLQQLPHCDTGLSMTQQFAVKLLLAHSKPMSVEALFARYQEREPLPFLGDLMFWAHIKPLTMGQYPLIERIKDSDSFSKTLLKVTPRGEQCIAGHQRYLGKECVGGVRVSPISGWQWDHHDLDTLTPFDFRD